MTILAPRSGHLPERPDAVWAGVERPGVERATGGTAARFAGGAAS
jgi:hypothetical protein